MKFIKVTIVEDIGHMVTLGPGESPLRVQDHYGPSNDLEELALFWSECRPPRVAYLQEPTADVLISNLYAGIVEDSRIVMAEVIEE